MVRFALSAVLVGTLSPAAAAAPVPDRAQVLWQWTQPTAASTAAWQAARRNRSAWAAYGFDWSSDRCTHAPERPFGFPFTAACRHHDFGYRNYRATGQFSAHRKRLDQVLLADLLRVCAGRGRLARPVCNTVALTYYEAVRLLGDS